MNRCLKSRSPWLGLLLLAAVTARGGGPHPGVERERAVLEAREAPSIALEGLGRLRVVPLGRGRATYSLARDGVKFQPLSAGLRLESIEGEATVTAAGVELRVRCRARSVADDSICWVLWSPGACFRVPRLSVAGVPLRARHHAVAGMLAFDRAGWNGRDLLLFEATLPLEASPEDPADRFAAWLPWDLDPDLPVTARLTVEWPDLGPGAPINGVRRDHRLTFESGPRRDRPVWGFVNGTFATVSRGVGRFQVRARASKAEQAGRLAVAALELLPRIDQDLGPIPDGPIDLLEAGPTRTLGRTVAVERVPGGLNDWSASGPLFALAHELAHLAWPSTGDHDSLAEGVAQYEALRLAKRLGPAATGPAILEHWAHGARPVKTSGLPVLALADPFREPVPGEPIHAAVYAAQPLALASLSRSFGEEVLLQALSAARTAGGRPSDLREALVARAGARAGQRFDRLFGRWH